MSWSVAPATATVTRQRSGWMQSERAGAQSGAVSSLADKCDRKCVAPRVRPGRDTQVGAKKEGKQRGMTGARGRGSLESAYKLVATHRATSAGLRIRVRVRLGFVLAAPSPVCIVHVEHGASDQIGMVMGRQTHDVRHEDSRTGAVAGSSGRQGEWTASPEEQRARILRRKPESDASEMLVCNAELEPEVELDNAATITPLGDENVAAHGGSGSAEHVAARSRTKTHSDRLSTRRLF
ncbi:hypothetical protein L1887_54810 [Cichorium endivia]|nr:hypothetical protein L1887_54810 [Cichorium endivia]